MSFKSIALRDVRFRNQRALLAHWGRLAAGRRFPAFTEFTLPDGIHDPKQLVVWNVEGRDATLKFRALYQGPNVSEVFNSAWAGKTMDQVLPMSLRKISLDAARECVVSGYPVYSIISTIDTLGRRVDCERLLLPFGHASAVDHILASLRLITVLGGMQREKILKNFQTQADVLLSGKIEPAFANVGPSTQTSVIDPDEGPPVSHGARAKQLKGARATPETFGPASEVGEKQRAPRRNILKAGRILFGKERLICAIRNISATGASIEVSNTAGVPDTFTLVVEMETSSRPCTIVWRKHSKMGVRFG